MIKYIHHISDIHIRLLKRHSEYREVFHNLYEKIKENSKDSIVVLTGDILHSKLEMGPELIDITSEFFTELAKITKVLIIPGNHDCSLANLSRMDSLSPIIENLNNKNIIYSKTTEIIEVENLQFAHQSIFTEKQNYIKPTDLKDDKIKIAIYHGVVSGADFGGFMVKEGEVEPSDFDGFDMVLLGDIHGTQCIQKRNKKGKKPEIWYAGSLIQNNYGEGTEKGYLLWNIETITPSFIKIKNDYGFHTIELTDGNYLIQEQLSKKPRIRLKTSNTTASDIHRICTDLKKQFEVQEIIINNVDRNFSVKKGSIRHGILDVRNIKIQNKLIKEYLESRYGVDDNLLNKIYSINKDTNKELSQNDSVKNVIWTPKMFEFSNMFSYGENNTINFGKLKNVIGLFAPNATGKSSIIDALMFCVFDRSSRAYKGINVLNSQKLTFSCKFNFEIDGVDFWIERRGYKQKNGNVKVDVNFWTLGDDGNILSLNGGNRDETNKNIRGYIGTYDDFVSTTMSFQNNNDSFIEKSQTERKDFLAKFLDIEVFDELYDIANEKVKEINILLSEYKKQDFSSKLSILETDFEKNKSELEKFLKEKDSLEKLEIKLDNQVVKETESKINTITFVDDIDIIIKDKRSYEDKLNLLTPQNSALSQKVLEYKTNAVELFNKIKELKQVDIEQKHIEYKSLLREHSQKQSILEREKIKIQQKKLTLADLEKHEYDPNCPYCVNNIFVKNAIRTKQELIVDQREFDILESNIKRISVDIFNMSHIEKEYLDFQNMTKQLEEYKILALKTETELNSITSQITNLQNSISYAENKIQEYENHKLAIDHNSLIDKKIKVIKEQLNNVVSNKKSTEQKLQACQVKDAVIKSEIDKIYELMQNAKDMEEKFKAYEFYTKSVSRDGVPYDLITNTIPTLQEEVNDILNQIVDFNIIFNLDGKNINAYIAYDDTKYWPIELVSGMEKFITSLAIRCALLNVSNLSRPNFLVIDEGFGVLDSDNISSLGYLFDYLKQKFEFVLIVSHIDSMKDMVDYALDISKYNGFSAINHS